MSIVNILSLQYDVELYQRIEQLLGKKLPLFKCEEEEVLSLQERVSEAQRTSRMVCLYINIYIILIHNSCIAYF